MEDAMSLAKLAADAQLRTGYRADEWIELKLPALTKLWQGVGGESDFFVSEEDARAARGAYVGSEPHRFAETLWRLAQVKPNPALGYRSSVREFVVDLDTPAAVSVCTANASVGGQWLGSGSVLQYFVPGWKRVLHPTGRELRFPQTRYPRI
jgi:hypothetical protein